MSRILAIEASTEQCSVALRMANDDYAIVDNTPRAHAQNLLPMVKKLLSLHDCTLNNLDGIVYGEGPGSFTGLRIALSTAQGLAFGADLPLISVGGLNALAYQYCDKGNDKELQTILTLLDARMGELYWALFSIESGTPNFVKALLTVNGSISGPECVESLVNTQRDASADTGVPLFNSTFTKIVGGGFELLSNDFVKAHQGIFVPAQPMAESMLDLSEYKLQKGHVIKPEYAEPLYLRNSVAWNKRKRIRQS